MNEIFLDFINTRWYISHAPYKDPLLDGSWLKGFLDSSVMGMDAIPTDAGRLIAFRGWLTDIADSLLETGTLDSRHVAEINRLLGKAPVCFRLDAVNEKYALAERPLAYNTDYIIALILKSFISIMCGAEKVHLQKCGNGDCRWLFIDRSKSHTRKWCSNTCASLIKVRRHRSRKETDC